MRPHGVVVALLLFLGCGSVSSVDHDAGTGGAAGKIGVTSTGGDGGATGGAGGAMAAAAGTSGSGGVAAAGGAGGGSGGQAGAAGAGGSVSCGSGPVLPGGDCSYDGQCLSGTCAGGLCANCSDPNCTAAMASAPALCADNGWIPTTVTDCGTGAPVCSRGYRCLNCGPLPGNTPPCIYDQAKTTICVASCSDCVNAE